MSEPTRPEVIGHLQAFGLARGVKFRALDGNFACIANYPSFGYRWEVDPLPISGGK